MRYINSVKELLAIYVGILLAAALAYGYFEHKPLMDSIWWACVTATTVGYGDMFPTTLGGRIVAVILMHLALLFILPLLIGNICARCIENRDAFTHDEQESLKAAIRRLEDKLEGR